MIRPEVVSQHCTTVVNVFKSVGAKCRLRNQQSCRGKHAFATTQQLSVRSSGTQRTLPLSFSASHLGEDVFFSHHCPALAYSPHRLREFSCISGRQGRPLTLSPSHHLSLSLSDDDTEGSDSYELKQGASSQRSIFRRRVRSTSASRK